eukprot:4283484-Pleurochrysis_carterae.AAC.5
MPKHASSLSPYNAKNAESEGSKRTHETILGTFQAQNRTGTLLNYFSAQMNSRGLQTRVFGGRSFQSLGLLKSYQTLPDAQQCRL